MATVVKGSAVKKNLKFFIYGRQGTWKSSLALQLAAMTREDGKPIRLLYIDAEYGSVDNYLEDFCDEYGVNPDNILLVKANTYNDIEDYINKAILNEEIYIEDENGNEEIALDAEGKPFVADAIVLDSATVIQDTTKYGMIKTSEKRAGLKAESRDATSTEKFVAVETAGMEFKDYDKLNQKGKNLLRSLVTRTDKYVCVISREKDETKKIKNSKGEFESVVVGHKPDCFKDAEYEFYTVLRMYEDENTGNVVAKVDRKDRTKLYERNSIIENPTLLAWQEVIDKNIGKKSAALDNRSYDEIIEEQANQLQKPKNSNKQEEQVVDVDNDKNTEGDSFDSSELFTQITDIRKRLKPQERSGLTVQLSKNGLPTPSKSLPIETLLKIKEICEEYEKGLQK